MQAIMMVAGKSTRTYPLTLTRPKPLLPVLNKPSIYYNLDQLVDIVQEVILIVGYRKDMIQETLGSNYKGIKLTYIEQKEQLGTGHAVLQAAHYVTDRCIVMNGDDLFAKSDIMKLLNFRYAALAMIVEDPSLYGVYQVNDEGIVLNLVEKPRENIGNLANVGCYLFDSSIFNELEKTPLSERGEIELTSAVLSIAKQHPFQVISLKEYWLPTGYPWDLLKTQTYFFEHNFDHIIDGRMEYSVVLNGTLQLGHDSIIHENVTIEGPVCIGSNCVIGKSSKVGPYTTIGNNTQIGTRCQIENSIIMGSGKIGNLCKISHSVLGKRVNLGESCILKHVSKDHLTIKSKIKNQVIDTGLTNLGATLGDDVLLEDHNQIEPGKKIWPKIKTKRGQHIENDLMGN